MNFIECVSNCGYNNLNGFSVVIITTVCTVIFLGIVIWFAGRKKIK